MPISTSIALTLAVSMAAPNAAEPAQTGVESLPSTTTSDDLNASGPEIDAVAPDDPAPVQQPAASTPNQGTASPNRLPDSSWAALAGKNVVVALDLGLSASGRVVAIDDSTVSLVLEDGQVVALRRAEITGVKATAEAPSRAQGPADGPVVDAPPRKPGARDWAVAGAATGLSITGVAFMLAIGAEVTRADTIPSLPLGATATSLFVGAVPVIAGGGISARRAGGVRGIPGLRISGWVAYGLTIADALALIAVGLTTEEALPGGLVTSVALLGTASASLMSADTLISHRQARAAGAAPQALGQTRRRLSVGPRALLGNNGGRGGMLSLAMSF